jgi:hypothetical protein
VLPPVSDQRDEVEFDVPAYYAVASSRPPNESSEETPGSGRSASRRAAGLPTATKTPTFRQALVERRQAAGALQPRTRQCEAAGSSRGCSRQFLLPASAASVLPHRGDLVRDGAIAKAQSIACR